MGGRHLSASVRLPEGVPKTPLYSQGYAAALDDRSPVIREITMSQAFILDCPYHADRNVLHHKMAHYVVHEMLGVHSYLYILVSDGCYHENGVFTVCTATDTKALQQLFQHKNLKMLLVKGKINILCS